MKAGDSVVLHWRPGAGIQADTAKYRWRGQPLNAGWVTTFNRHAVVSENRTKVPASTDPEAAALFGCAVTTGFGVVENNARLRDGRIRGGVRCRRHRPKHHSGSCTCFGIADHRCGSSRQSVGVGQPAGRYSHHQQFKGDVAELINKALAGQSLDVFIDNTGVPTVIELGYELTQREGRVILVGVPRLGQNLNVYSLPLHFGKVLSGSQVGNPNLIATFLGTFDCWRGAACVWILC